MVVLPGRNPRIGWHRVVIPSSFRNVSITLFIYLKLCTIGQANLTFTYLALEQVTKYLVINFIIKPGH